MDTPSAMNILVCRNAVLGPPDGLKWLQRNISVPYWRVYWNDAPGAFIGDASGELELTPDMVAAIPPRTVYSTRAERRTSHFYVHFTTLEPFESAEPGIMVFRSARLVALAAEIAGALGDPGVRAKTILKTHRYVCELLLSIPDERLPAERRLSPPVEEALALLDAKPGISIEELSREMRMSRNGLTKLFTKATGVGPKRFSRRRRLEQASMLLHFSDKTIKQIAEETGFCDRYHLSRLFRREFGCGPAQFRSQMENYRER